MEAPLAFRARCCGGPSLTFKVGALKVAVLDV